MKLKVVNQNAKAVGDIELDDLVYGLTPREDILARVVTWQLAKRRSGNHKTKVRSEVSGSTRKIYKQKQKFTIPWKKCKRESINDNRQRKNKV